MKFAASMIALACVGTAALAQSEDDKLTGDELKALYAATPYECSGYEPLTDSCETLAKVLMSGETMTAGGKSMLDETSDIAITANGALNGDRICVGPNDYEIKVSGPNTDMNGMVETQTKAFVSQFGVVCTTYYDNGDGSYLSVTAQEDGTPVPMGTETVHFFPDEKPLRVERSSDL